MIAFKPKAAWKKIQHPFPGDWYTWGELGACVTLDPDGWHVSVSHPRRYPTWDEIHAAWYDLVPGAGRDFEGAIILPRQADYVNLHKNCFHVHQLRDDERPSRLIP